MTLLDVTMAMAARSESADMGVVTIEMKTSFMQPARGPLVAKGVLLHRTATMAFTEGTRLRRPGQPVQPCHRHLQVRQAPAVDSRRPTR